MLVFDRPGLSRSRTISLIACSIRSLREEEEEVEEREEEEEIEERGEGEELITCTAIVSPTPCLTLAMNWMSFTKMLSGMSFGCTPLCPLGNRVSTILRRRLGKEGKEGSRGRRNGEREEKEKRRERGRGRQGGGGKEGWREYED